MQDAEGSPDGVTLPASATAAWQAYLGMCAAKAAHFDWLRELSDKYRHGGNRTLAEGARLGSLLEAHDEAVKHFVVCLGELKARDTAGHAALVTAMTRAGRQATAPDDPTARSAH